MTIHRRSGSDMFHYDFTVAGVRYRGSTKEKTQARANMVEADLIMKARNQQLPAGFRKAPTFLEFADEFTTYIENTRLAPGTKRYYKDGLRRLKEKPMARMRIDAINSRTIETTQFEGSGSHVNGALRTLNRMLHLAQEWNLILKVPKIKLARENKRVAIFDAMSEKTALENLEQPWRDVILIMNDAGMRNQEAVAVRWEHCDFERDLIYNPRVKADDTDGWVPMSERLKSALLARRRGQKQGWVFPSKRSKTGHLCDNVSRAFRLMRQQTGLPQTLVPYSARHSFGTAMLEMTGDPVFTGKLMGHKNPLTTMRYLHPSLRRAKELIDTRNKGNEEKLRHILRHSEGFSGAGESGVTA